MTQKIGAQRLYKAVKTGNISMIVLFLSSENKGAFDYQKTFEAWVEAGKDVEVLEVLLQYEPFQRFKAHWRVRRGKKKFKNDDFRFAVKILELLKRQINYTDYTTIPPTEDLLWFKQVTKILASFEGGEEALNRNGIGSALVDRIKKNLEWPWVIAAESRGLAFEIMTRSLETHTQRTQAITWFLDMHGPIVEKDFENYSNDINRFMDNQKYWALQQLIPDEALRKKLFEQSQFKMETERITREHKKYLKLIEIAPWIENEEKELNDSDD